MASSWQRIDSRWSDIQPIRGWDNGVEDDYDNVDEDTGAAMFVDMLVDLKTRNLLSAAQCCILAFWAGKGGCKGEATKLGTKPNQQSGAYSRHFDNWSNAGVHSVDAYEARQARKQ